MSNLYHKIAFASVCTALSFALGANKEATAGNLTLGSSTSFFVGDTNRDGLGDYFYGNVPLPVGVKKPYPEEFRAFYEFNIANLLLDSNTVKIKSAIFKGRVNSIENQGQAHPVYSRLNAIGYVGDGNVDLSDFSKGGVSLTSIPNSSVSFNSIPIQSLSPGGNFYFDATTFIKQIVSNNEPFAGFKFLSTGDFGNYESYITLDSYSSTLTITTEPVPEPTTIFGSALALSLGGWFKRKKSNQKPNKTTPQH